MMKKVLIFVVSFFGLSTALMAQTPSCTFNSDNEIITDSNGYVDCVADNGEQSLQIQYLGLCTSTPNVSDYQDKCQAIFNQPSGKGVVLTKDSSVNLLNGQAISISEGTYTHAVVRIDSLIKMRGTYVFDKPMLGGAGGTGKTCWTAATGTVGTYSDTQDYFGYTSLDQLATQCGTTASPEFTSQDYTAFTTASGFTNTITGRTSPSGPYEMYTLKTPNSLSSTNPSTLDGEHLLGIQTFNNPVVITPNLKSINFGFKLENMFHIQTNWQSTLDPSDASVKRSPDGAGFSLPTECGKYRFGGNSCLKYVIPMGFEFSASTQ